MVNRLKYFYKNYDSDIGEVISKGFKYFVLNIVGVILQFIITFSFTRTFGAESWGVFALFFTYINLISYCACLGLDVLAVRKTAGDLTEENYKINFTFWFKVLSFVLCTSLVISILHFLYSKELSYFYFNSGNSNLVIMLAIGIPIFSLINIFLSLLRGLKKTTASGFFKNTLIWIITAIVFWLLTKTTVGSDSSIVLIVSLVLSGAIILISCFLYLLKLDLKPIKSKGSQAKDSIFQYLKLSYPFLIIYIVHASNLSFDKIILKNLLDVETVGIYDVVLKINSVPNLIFIAINSILMPKFSQLYSQNQKFELKQLAKKSTKIIFYVSLPIILILMIFSNDSLLFFGPEFSEGYFTLLLMLGAQIIAVATGSPEVLLQMTNNQRVFQWVFGSAMLINIILCVILVPIMGILGAGIAKVCAIFFWRGMSIRIVQARLKISTVYIPFFYL